MRSASAKFFALRAASRAAIWFSISVSEGPDKLADCPLNQPEELDKLLALRRFPKVYVKISHSWSLSAEKYPYPDSQRQIKRLYDAFGPRRLMAGSDWPLVEKFCTYAQAIDIARQRISFFSAEDKRWICGLTAQQVWPFGMD